MLPVGQSSLRVLCKISHSVFTAALSIQTPFDFSPVKKYRANFGDEAAKMLCNSSNNHPLACTKLGAIDYSWQSVQSAAAEPVENDSV